jgi:hypothetical protein
MLKLGVFLILLFLGLASYNEGLGQKLCKLAVASYCKQSAVASWSCAPCKSAPLGMSNIKLFINSSADTLGFIGTSSELNAIGTIERTQCWCSGEPSPGTSRTGSAILTS